MKAKEQKPEVVEQKAEVVEQEQPKSEQKPKKKYAKKTAKEKSEKMQKALKKLHEDEEKRKKKEMKEREKAYIREMKAHWKEERAKLKEEREREFRKFNCPELIRLFGGWFTLTYAFSVKSRIDKRTKNGMYKTDYYICSQDVSGIDVNKRPGINRIIQREFGKEVYGCAIIAPASAFGEGGTMV